MILSALLSVSLKPPTDEVFKELFLPEDFMFD